MNGTQNMTLTITTYNDDNTVASVSEVGAIVITSAADLEAYFAAALAAVATTEVN